MRPIEFRAWDKDANQMIYLDFKNMNPHLSRLSVAWFADRIQDERAELMQFTGLLDKNGKKIFEGDIVKGKVGQEEVIGKIFYAANSAAFLLSTKNKHGVQIALDPMSWLYVNWDSEEIGAEIIGNIYENPELIGG